MRHGSRAATSPPGSGTYDQWAMRSDRRALDDQELASPDRPVVPRPGAVERDPDDRLGAAVLGDTRQHMRVVVLDCDTARRQAYACARRVER